MPKPPHGLGRLAGEWMTIGIHGERDLRVPHDGLDDLRMLARMISIARNLPR